MNKIRACLIFVFLFRTVVLQAQVNERISDSFSNISLEEFFSRLEKKIPYKFYYNTSELKTLYLSLEIKDLTLPHVLQEAFKATDLHFAIDKQSKSVYITSKFPIETELPAGYFKRIDSLALQKSQLSDSVAEFDVESKKRVSKAIAGKLYEIGNKTNQAVRNAILTGYVRNAKTGEPLANASVFTDNQLGTITDQYGHYSLTLPAGNHTLNIQHIGMKDTRMQLVVYSEGKLDIDVDEQVQLLREVIVSSNKISNIKNVQMGMERLAIANIKNIPSVFGEADVLRVITSLPGVKTVGEASTGFNVRGGSADQNLILFNDATIFNPSHFFGMFSAFNPEIVKDVELYKSSIPAKYGGRLSSVLDISTREGNKKNITGSAGIGVTTSRLNIEGPIVKDKTSFIFGGRTTYANWLISLLPDPYDRAKASFNDGNLSISHRMNQKNDFYFTGYFSNDRFNLASDTTYNYSNRNVSVKWKHNFNSKLLSYFTAGYDQYKYGVFSEANKVNAYTLSFDINQANFKADFSYLLHAKHNLNFGVHSILYKLHPGSFVPRGKESLVATDVVAPEQALESALYLSDRYTVSTKLSLEAGMRYSVLNNLGPKEVAIYASGVPRDESSVVERKSYEKNKITQIYKAPEVRVSVRYSITNSFSVKAGYNSMRQYLHVLSNTTAIAPTDIWKLSDPNIRPQRGDQVSLGIYKNLKSNTIETSWEVYYKRIKDYLDYKPGATLVLNHDIETEVLQTKGKAYGTEVMIRKPGGKLNGWISYTYSRVLLKMDDSTIGIPVNKGAYYPANYDKPHDITMVGNFKVNHRFSLSLNMTYSTGRPITLPVGRYYYAGSQRVSYSDRNSYRIPDYFRTDFSMNIDGNYKVKQKTHNSWTIGIYNLTGRKNPFSVYYVSENGRVNGYRLSIFGNLIPFINFNIRF